MKNIRFPALALAGAVTLSLVLAACGPKAPETTPTPEVTETPDMVETVVPTETLEVSPEVTEPAETATPPAQTQKPVQTPPVETVQPTEAPSETPAEDSKVQAVWSAIANRELPAFQDLDDSLLTDFYGVDPADLVEYICKIPFMNTQATEFFIAQVQPGKLDTVKSALESRQATLKGQWSQYLPDQLELVENYKLVTNGDYIMFAVTEYADEVVSDFNSNTK